jgi:A/G-specific adenine glycosylase
LGYYSRARNLHATAKNIVENYNGVIPNTFFELKKLKGIGAYTAAAIASVVFDEPVPVVDGNVMRVVARLFAIEDPIDGSEGKNKIQHHLNTIFDAKQPGIFNEAIMEFGALQCVPSNPNCGKCPLLKYCAAYKMSKVNVLPMKNPAKEVKTRYLNYLFLLIDGNYTLMKQRNANDIWKNLYEFPLIETEHPVAKEQLCDPAFWMPLRLFTKNADDADDADLRRKTKDDFLQYNNYKKTLSFKQTFHYQHKLTHRLLKVTFTVATINFNPETINFNPETLNFKPATSPPISLLEAESKPKPVLIAQFLKTIIPNLKSHV